MSSHRMNLVLVVILLVGANSQKNYVTNGYFISPNVTMLQGKVITAGRINGWTGDIIEVGLGVIYNSNWDDGVPVLTLDTGKNQKISQCVNLPSSGRYVLKFRYSSREDYAASSGATVNFNEISKDFTLTSDEIHEQQIIVQCESGANTLTFIGTGKEDGYGFTVSYITLTSYNIFINGDVEYPPISVFKTEVDFKKGILGWQADNQLDIGLGSSFNSNWDPDTQVLNAFCVNNVPQVMSQTFHQLNIGVAYTLSFHWAARTINPLGSQTAIVSWNGGIVKSIAAQDFGLHFEMVSVTAALGINRLTVKANKCNGLTNGIDFDNFALY